MEAAYFGILLGVAWWVVRKNKDTAADYFLAGRNLGWWVIGASIFASNIGSEHIVGLAGSGAKDGVAMAHYELARLVPAGAGVGVRAVLRPLAGVHHAGVPRTRFSTSRATCSRSSR
jgi:Na+/proline symporter